MITQYLRVKKEMNEEEHNDSQMVMPSFTVSGAGGYMAAEMNGGPSNSPTKRLG